MKKVYFPVIVLLLAVFAFFMLRPDPPTNAPDPAQLTDPATFVLNQYRNLESLQKALDANFPNGSDPEILDSTLMRSSHIFSTGNIIKSFYLDGPSKDWHLTPGSSTGENFTFYFRPEYPAGKDGWEDATSGWVIKMITIDQRKIVRVLALAVPDTDTATGTKEHESVSYVKELLEHVRFEQKTNPFNNEEWLSLVSAQLNAPCLTNLTETCLAREAYTLVGLPDAPLRFTYYAYFGWFALNHNNPEMAAELLAVWPTEEQVRAYHLNKPRMRRFSEKTIERDVAEHEGLRAALYVIKGDMETGKKLLTQAQERWKEGNDFFVIRMLVMADRLDDAYDIAKMMLRWRRGTDDPNVGSSAILHCEYYGGTRPANMGLLAGQLIIHNKLDRAKDVIEMLRVYYDNNTFGQQSHCYHQDARNAYMRSQLTLINKLFENGSAAEAKKLLGTIVDEMQTADGFTQGTALNLYMSFCKVAIEQKDQESLSRLSIAIENYNESNLSSYQRRHNQRLVAFAMCGFDEKVETFLEHKASAEKYDNYLKIAATLMRNDGANRAQDYIKRAHAFLPAFENETAQQQMDLLKAKLDIADLYVKVGQIDSATKLAEEMLPYIKQVDTDPAIQKPAKRSFFTRFSRLQSQTMPVRDMVSWMYEVTDAEYSSSHPGIIAGALIKRGNLEELDLFINSTIEKEKRPMKLTEIKRSLYNVLDKEDLESRYPALQSVDTSDIRSNPIDRGLAAFRTLIKTPSPDLAEAQKLWLYLFKNCDTDILRLYGYESRRWPDARETMAACYLQMLQ